MRRNILIIRGNLSLIHIFPGSGIYKRTYETRSGVGDNLINLIVDVSKYLMILLMAVYTYLNFRFFGVGEEKKRRICGKQNVVMFFNQMCIRDRGR